MDNDYWNYEIDTLLLADHEDDQITPEIKYYYLCAVRSKVKENMTSELYLDSVLSYTTADIKQAALARGMVENELIITTVREAVEAVGLKSMSEKIYGFDMRVKVNMLTVHKFVCDSPMDEDDLDIYIRSANFCESSRKKLQEARVRY
jgi:hypothetical protein